MSQTQGILSAQNEGLTPIGNRSYMAFFSSAAITFGAMMAMLQAEQKAMSGMAQLAEVTTGGRATAAISVGTSIQNASNDDAASYTQQSYEQWATVGSSLTQVGMGLGGLKGTASATKFSTKMDEFTDEASGVGIDSHLTVGPEATNPNSNPLTMTNMTDEQRQIVADTKAKLKGAGLHLNDYKKMINGGKLDEDLGHGVTLRHVLSCADDANELSDLRTGLRKGKEDALKAVEREHSTIQMKVQIGNAMGQAAASGATSQMRLGEAQANRDKGADSMQQSLAQNNLSFAQETQKSQTDQIDKWFNQSCQAIQSAQIRA